MSIFHHSRNFSTGLVTGFMAAILTAIALIVAPIAASAATPSDGPIIVQSTTSTQNSGLYNHILPIYQDDTGHIVRVVAVGTGQAIKNAKNCDGDVLLVHSKADEDAFVAQGFGLRRQDVMYNDFVMIGPNADPADVKTSTSITEALRRIAASTATFISRGDDSGTHKAEQLFWQKANLDPRVASGQWYLETGQGMGSTLNVSIQLNGYVISDRSTWMGFGNHADHSIVFEGGNELFNQYGVIVVNPEKCPSVNINPAQTFADWIVSDKGQDAINSYNVNGHQVFFGNAK
jgi:tungstate transport system substrate-binding protein